MLRQLFFGIGVLLGLVPAQEMPDLSVRIYRGDDAIYLNAELLGAFPEGSLELAADGTEVAFRLEARAEGANPVVALRSLRFDAGTARWIVGYGSGDGRRSLADREAARLLASRLWALRLGGLSGFPKGVVITITAKSGIIDGSGSWHDAGILWGYAEPGRRFAFADTVEIPR
ncbi:MAG: hypothetical protein WCQ50_10135 [Spirochaetota bacterium]